MTPAAAAGGKRKKKKRLLTPKATSLPLLKALRKCQQEERGEILKNLGEKGVDSIGQYVFNLAHSNLPMRNNHKRRIKGMFEDHMVDLRPVMNGHINVTRRRNLLVRQNLKGGVLDGLLKTGLPYLEKIVVPPPPSSSSSSSSSSPSSSLRKNKKKTKTFSMKKMSTTITTKDDEKKTIVS